MTRGLCLAVAAGCFCAACGSTSVTSVAPTPVPTPAPVVAAPAPEPAPDPQPAPQPEPTPEPPPAPEPAPAPQPAPSPGPPPASGAAIANLTASFSGGSCTRPADHLTGRALVVNFDFTDGRGDLAGGRVELDRVYNTGRSEFHIYPIPTEVTLSGGSTAGHMQLTGCPLYDDNQTSKETLTFTDADGFVSNSLSVTVTRPAGAP